MKKVKFLLVSLISLFAFNINVIAASGSLSVSSSNVYVGDKFTVTVNVRSAAAWNIHVSASGPVSGCSINQADATSDAMDTNKSFSATCTATGTGTISIILSGDVTSANDGNAVNVSGSKNVTVLQKSYPSSNNNQTPDNRSKNSNIKELSVDGYELIKVDNNNYTLSVPNDVTSINIKATAEDSKSKVTGTGSHDINVGENNIEVVVTAENGSKNKINIKVTRKDGYYLDDLDSVLNNEKIEDINIIINADSKITESQLEKIKNSKKTVKFNYFDENKKLIYSWIINGKEIDDTKELTTTITFTTENKNEIYKLSNYADGLYINFKHDGILPAGTKIKLYVGDKFEDDSIVNVYKYNNINKSLKFIKDSLKVTTGYIEFEIEHCSEYFVTMSNVDIVKTQEISSINIFMIFSIVELIVIFALVFVIVKKIKK